MLNNNNILAYTNSKKTLKASLINYKRQTNSPVKLINNQSDYNYVDPIKLSDNEILILPDIIYSVNDNKFKYLDKNIQKKYSNFFKDRKYKQADISYLQTFDNRYVLWSAKNTEAQQIIWLEDLVLLKRSNYLNTSVLNDHIYNATIKLLSDNNLLIFTTSSLFKADFKTKQIVFLTKISDYSIPHLSKFVKLNNSMFYFSFYNYGNPKLYNLKNNKLMDFNTKYNRTKNKITIINDDKTYNFFLVRIGKTNDYVIYSTESQNLIPVESESGTILVKVSNNEIIMMGGNLSTGLSDCNSDINLYQTVRSLKVSEE